MIISIDAGNPFGKIKYVFMIKKSQQNENKIKLKLKLSTKWI